MKNHEDCGENLDVRRRICRRCVYNPAEEQLQFSVISVGLFEGRDCFEDA